MEYLRTVKNLNIDTLKV
jgi:hypothetical protein